jgi:hypothetical protein
MSIDYARASVRVAWVNEGIDGRIAEARLELPLPDTEEVLIFQVDRGERVNAFTVIDITIDGRPLTPIEEAYIGKTYKVAQEQSAPKWVLDSVQTEYRSY